MLIPIIKKGRLDLVKGFGVGVLSCHYDIGFLTCPLLVSPLVLLALGFMILAMGFYIYLFMYACRFYCVYRSVYAYRSVYVYQFVCTYRFVYEPPSRAS